MLDSHPHLAIPPETGFLAAIRRFGLGLDTRKRLFRLLTGFPPDTPNWKDFGVDAELFRAELEKIEPFNLSEGIRAFYRIYAANHGKSRFGDKTPTYCCHIRRIENLLPEACWIHIIRDGRDVALSLRETWFAPSQDIKELAAYWRKMVIGARRAGQHSSSYMEVRYEDLIHDAQPVLQRICSRTQLDFDPAMLRYWEHAPERLKEHQQRQRANGEVVVSREQRLHQQRLTMHPPQPDRIAVWRREMTVAEQADFRRSAGDLLEELGYDW